MKKIGLFVVLGLSLAVISAGQQNAADRLFEKYAGKEGFTTVSISKGMFQLASQLNINDPEANELINGLESIKILAMDDNYAGKDIPDFYDAIISDLPADRYDELMVVQEKDEKVKILARQEEGYIRELLLVAGGKDDNALIIIRGRLSPKSLASISRNLDIHGAGLEYLEELETEK